MARFAVHLDPGRSDHEGLTRLFGKVLTGSGVVETDDLEVTAQASPDMTVEVAGGDIAIYDDDTLYHGWATTSETVVIPANNSGVTKTDAVVAYIDLTAGSSTSNNPDALAYEVVRRGGTDTGAPTAGEIEAEVGEVYHLLALVEVGNGVSSINSGNITDEREFCHLDGGRLAPGSVTPAKRSGGFKIGVINSSVTGGSTGSRSITGVGFRPKTVRFSIIPPSSGTSAHTAHGAMDEDGNQYTTAVRIAAGGSEIHRNGTTSACIAYLNTAASVFGMVAEFGSMDEDGFTINVTTPGSTFDIAWEAYG